MGKNAIRPIPGFTNAEAQSINEAKQIMSNAKFDQIRKAHEAKQSVTITLGGRLIQYEPGLPASGMTLFGENGFLIGREAFAAPQELQQTVLHELYRLYNSTSKNGLCGNLATHETKAAADFAAKALKVIR